MMDKLLNLKNFPVLNKGLTKDIVVESIRLLFIFGSDGGEVIFGTNEDLVYGFGFNRNGCLGLGHNKQNLKYLQLNQNLSGKELVDISYGFHHCIGLTASGQCYGWGENGYGELGLGTLSSTFKPALISQLQSKRVVQICCGNFFSMALTDEGQVYGWGRNTVGQLCDGSTNNQPIPQLIDKLSGHQISSLSCGRSHVMALTQEGRMYWWGSYKIMCTGNSLPDKFGKINKFPDYFPELNNFFIKKVICGPNHSLLLTIDGHIYGFGNNSNGQIGNGSTLNQNKPVMIESDIKFKDVFAYRESNLSIGISEDNKYYVWGLVKSRNVLIPELVDNPSIYSVYDLQALYGVGASTFQPVVIKDHLKLEESKNEKSNEFVNNLNHKSNHQMINISTKNNISVRVNNGSDDDIRIVKTVLRSVSQNSSNTDIPHTFDLNSNKFSSNVFFKYLSQSFNNTEDYDLKLIFNEKTIYCHKTILKIRNKKFWQKCENQFKNGMTDEIRIKAYSYNTFFAFVGHLYGQTPEVNDENCSDLLKMATIFDELELKEFCTEYLANRIDSSNVCSIYEKAINTKQTHLEKSCIEFVSKNYKQVFNSKSFQSLEDAISRQLIHSMNF